MMNKECFLKLFLLIMCCHFDSAAQNCPELSCNELSPIYMHVMAVDCLSDTLYFTIPKVDYISVDIVCRNKTSSEIVSEVVIGQFIRNDKLNTIRNHSMPAYSKETDVECMFEGCAEHIDDSVCGLHKINSDVIHCDPPVIPVNVSYTVSFTDVSLVWKNPTSSQNGSTTEYEIIQTMNNTNNSVTYTTTDTTFTINNLTPGTTYIFSISAYTGSDEGPATIITVTTEIKDPIPAVNASYTASYTNVSLFWIKPNPQTDIITKYEIIQTMNDTNNSVIYTTTDTTFTATNLTPGTTYIFSISAYTGSDEGLATIITVTTKIKDAIPAVNASYTASYTNVSLFWKKPNPQTDIITKYEIIQTMNDTNNSVTYTTTDTTFTINNLTPGTTYIFSISAYAGSDEGPATIITVTTEIKDPIPAVNASYTASYTNVSLFWIKPNPQTDIITKYEIIQTMNDTNNSVTYTTTDTTFTATNLTPGTTYIFSISAYTGSDEGLATIITVTTKIKDAIPAVNASYTASYTNVSLFWKKPNPQTDIITKYEIIQTMNDTNNSVTYTTTDTTFTINNLTPGTTYIFSISAYAGSDEGPATIITVTTEIKDPIPAVNASYTASYTNVSLFWIKPNPQTDIITKYEIIQTMNDTNNSVTYTTTDTTFTATNLTPGTTYIFSISAYTGSDEGLATIITVTTKIKDAIPAVNASYTASYTNVSLFWKKPNPQTDIITKYEIIQTMNDTNNSVTYTTTDTTFTINNLTPGTTYIFSISAYAGSDEGPATIITVTTEIKDPIPAVNASYTASYTNVSLFWIKPNPQTDIITKYEIIQTMNNTNNSVTYTTTDTTFTINNLTPGTTYIFSISAYTGSDEGPATIITVTTEIKDPIPAVNASYTASYTNVSLFWKKPNPQTDIITKYEIIQTMNDTNNSVIYTTTDTTFTATNLTPGTTYIFSISAYTGSDEGLATIITVTTKIKDAIPAVNASYTASYTNVSLFWKKPNPQTDIITKYEIIQTMNDTNNSVTYTTTDTTFTINNLTPGTTYIFSISAYAGSDEGPATIITVTTEIKDPIPAVNASYTASYTNVSLFWIKPNPQTDIITKYEIIQTMNDTNNSVTYTTTDTTFTATNLTPGTTYIFSISAYTGSDEGLATIITVTTKIKDAIPAVNASYTASYTNVSLFWKKPNPQTDIITKYEIIQTMNDTNNSVTYTTTDTTFTINNLTPGTTYIFSISAYAGSDEGPATIITVTTEIKDPIPAVNASYTASYTNVSLFWKKPNSQNDIITKYEIIQTMNDTNNSVTYTTTDTTFTINNLTPGTTYIFSISAYTGSDKGPTTIITVTTKIGVYPVVMPKVIESCYKAKLVIISALSTEYGPLSHYYIIVTNNKVNSAITNNTDLYPYDNDKWRPFGYYIAAVHNYDTTNDNTILMIGDNSTTVHNKQEYLNGPLEEGQHYRIMIRLFSATKKVYEDSQWSTETTMSYQGGVNSGQYTLSPLLAFIFVTVSLTTKMIM